MTRAKTKPPVRKPIFEQEGILRFAAMEIQPVGDAGPAPGIEPAAALSDRKPAKKMDRDRLSLTLTLKTEVIGLLKAEAGRKEKTIDQIVEKLVTKHLGK